MTQRMIRPSAAHMAGLIQSHIHEGRVRANYFVNLRALAGALVKGGILRKDVAAGVTHGVGKGWWTTETAGVLTLTQAGADAV
ncbi:hypothetical protein GXW71_32745 [Roseomonas hellenica]|uniref:Uncharacterized protein n=1 Tax=Plastoroseomonas hellenica TaxID=2687306 RepID=A0ABS5FAL8_9PROT|nr:hypothetical protein [Plastoroseomonas hellenica]MBR0669165.1 hypothetical protein [Plastoroseomonas hellenica]